MQKPSEYYCENVAPSHNCRLMTIFLLVCLCGIGVQILSGVLQLGDAARQQDILQSTETRRQQLIQEAKTKKIVVPDRSLAAEILVDLHELCRAQGVTLTSCRQMSTGEAEVNQGIGLNRFEIVIEGVEDPEKMISQIEKWRPACQISKLSWQPKVEGAMTLIIEIYYLESRRE